MYKKILYSLVLMVIGLSSPSFAQETLTVYDGDATNSYVPIYGFYADAFLKAEFVMNGNDITELTGSTITSLTWYLSSPASADWGNAVFQIFIKEVGDPAISEYSGPEGATIVYEGALDGTSETMEIEFTTPYAYEGGNLLIGVYGIQKGTYKSATFYGATVAGASVQGYSYSSLDQATCTQRDFVPKTTFTYIPSSGVVYYKPTNLQASDITTNSATITWTPAGEEMSWNVEYKKKNEEEWISAGTVTSPEIELDVLANGEMYEVRVQSDYGDGHLSAWAVLPFNTLVCDESEKGEVIYVLTDTYGDGWNGSKLQFVYHNTGLVVEEVTLPSGRELTGTVNLCYGEDYDLVWVAGSYVYEAGFQVFAPDGSIIYEYHGTGSSSTSPVINPGVLTTFQISRVTCPRPTNLEATDVVYNGATLTWTPGDEEQDLWQVVYGVDGFDPATAEPVTVNGEPMLQITNLMENTTYKAYVRSTCSEDDISIWSAPCTFTTPLRFPIPTDLEVYNIAAKKADASWNGVAETYNLRYRMKTGLDESFEDQAVPGGWTVNDWVLMPITQYTMGGVPLYAADGDNCMASMSVDAETGSSLNVDNWLISPKVDLGGTLELYAADLGSSYIENYSVYVSTTGTDVADFTALGENINTLGVLNQWDKKEFDLSAYQGQTGYIAIRHHNAQGYYLFIDAVSIAGEAIHQAEWVVMEGVTSPVTMEPLTPGTTYEVQVQAVYEDGNSAWCDIVTFTTDAADAMPFNLDVPDVTDKTATVTWEGSQDSYNLRYRTAAIINGISEDFTGVANGGLPEGWTAIDADGDGYNWAVWVLNMDDGSTQITLSSNSYVNYVGALHPDNWAVTPQSLLGNQVMFDAWGQDPSYASEVFRVYVSTTGTDIADFVPISDEITATGTQTTYTFDLGEYAGQQGYIAIRHYNCTDMYILNVTNFYIASESDVPAGDWVVVENVNAPYIIEGLNPETTYEVEVQGVLADGGTTDWTDPERFTTLEDQGGSPTEQCLAPNTSYAITGTEIATVTIVNREEGATVNYEVYCNGVLIETGSFTGDEYSFDVTGPGNYVIHAVATKQGKQDSFDGGVFFTILEGEGLTGIDEMSNGKTIASIRYFNAAGQEMQEVNGMTIVVTTYTDGTTATAKVMK